MRLTATAICGTDLHFVRGSMSGMKPGTILGHEGVGVVEQVGEDVRNLAIGDRVVICSTIGCGSCNYCRAGYYAQCQEANPNGPDAGTSFFGGPELTGPFDGLQAEKARIPYAQADARSPSSPGVRPHGLLSSSTSTGPAPRSTVIHPSYATRTQAAAPSQPVRQDRKAPSMGCLR